MTDYRTKYDSGLPFSTIIDTNIKSQLARVDMRLASCFIIDGAVGTGKTTLAVQIANRINELKGLPPISLDVKYHPQISLGGSEFTACFKVCQEQKLPVIIYDEAGDFNRRGAMSSFNQTINRIFETYRGFKIIVILCLPNCNALDGRFFENKIPRFLIHIKNRTLRQTNLVGYNLGGIGWIRQYYKQLSIAMKHKAYSYARPLFYAHSLNLEPETDALLDKLSTYGKKQLLKKAEKDLKGLVTYTDISKKMGGIALSKLRNQISKLNIKPVAKDGLVSLFNESVIDILMDHNKTLWERKGKPLETIHDT